MLPLLAAHLPVPSQHVVVVVCFPLGKKWAELRCRRVQKLFHVRASEIHAHGHYVSLRYALPVFPCASLITIQVFYFYITYNWLIKSSANKHLKRLKRLVILYWYEPIRRERCDNIHLSISQDHYLLRQFIHSLYWIVPVVCRYTGRFANDYAKVFFPVNCRKVHVFQRSVPWRVNLESTELQS